MSLVYPRTGGYLKATDVPSPATLTIASATVDNQFDQEQIVLSFVELDKRKLRLNTTNARFLAERHGDETEAWVGKKVVLASVPTQFQGKAVAGLRILG